METFRTFLDALRDAGELVEVHKPVDVRHVAALVDQASTALLFHRVAGYDLPVVSGLLNDRKRIALSAGCDYAQMEQRLSRALDHPIDPVTAHDGGERRWFRQGAAVDLFDLPVPVFSEFDGGPTITAGVTLAHDPEHGLNAGTYRFQVKERNLTGIDIVTPNNLRRLAEKALAANAPLPISINIGTHPLELMASLYKAPLGRNELAIAGGMLGRPVRLGACRTIDTPCLADAEIVLEAEILPTGWTRQEGRFGEMTRLMGDVHSNPHVRVKAISRRDDAVYYALHMPWENIWIKEHGFQAVLKRVLDAAGVTVTAVNVTPGGCCHWHAIIAIRKQPGDPQNAIMAALSVADLKHVVIVDDDIDVYDAMEVEWAMATRVQADRDVTILSDARSKPLDPSLPLSDGIPTTAKMSSTPPFPTMFRRHAISASPIPTPMNWTSTPTWASRRPARLARRTPSAAEAPKARSREYASCSRPGPCTSATSRTRCPGSSSRASPAPWASFTRPARSIRTPRGATGSSSRGEAAGM